MICDVGESRGRYADMAVFHYESSWPVAGARLAADGFRLVRRLGHAILYEVGSMPP